MSRSLVITRGLPASGKTTLALEWVRADPEGRARTNRDETRHLLYGAYWGLSKEQEDAVTHAQRAVVRSLLAAGKSVIVDDTNLDPKRARGWADLAHREGAGFSVLEVPATVEQCLARDKLRGEHDGRTVGEEAIQAMARRWPDRPLIAAAPEPAGRPRPAGVDPLLPWAWLFDIDGTLAHNDGHRGWYGDEELKAGGDQAHEEVVSLARALIYRGDELVFWTGRSDRARQQTKGWLWERLSVVADDDHLLMRRAGDRRPDEAVKDELYERGVRGRWNVRAAFEDRPAVAAMCRRKGLRVLACGDPRPGDTMA